MKRTVLALGVLLAMPALATQAVSATVEDLARASDAVVRARVVSQRSYWSSDRRHIYTDVELAPEEVWRGAAPERVTVNVPGGVADGIGQRVDGMAAFSTGEEAVVFLQRHGDRSYVVVGHAQGKFSVTGDTASPDLDRVELLHAPARDGERRSGAMPLAELRRRVRSLP